MTPEQSATSEPQQPQRRPQFVGRVLCIINAPARSTAVGSVTLMPASSNGKGWFVVRERWSVEL